MSKIDLENLKDKDGNFDINKVQEVVDRLPIVPPVTVDRQKDFTVKVNRSRMSSFPDRLPTMGLMPFPIDEHEHIGNYETPHNLYLTLARAYNKLTMRLEDLEKRMDSYEKRME